MAGYKSIRGTCALCKQQGVTNYHYKKIHQLIPKEIFRYVNATKAWGCHLHNVQSPDPHTMMWHYKQVHMGGPITGAVLDVDTLGGKLPEQTITAEAIVTAFEERVKGIDELLAEKDKELHLLHTVISELNAQLADTYKKHQAEIDRVKAQREQIDARADSLVNRLFGR